MLKQIESKQTGVRGNKKLLHLQILSFIFFIGVGGFQFAFASVVTDFETDGAASFNDKGKDGLTKITLVIRDDSAIKIDFSEDDPGFQDERFSFFILTKMPQGLSNLRFSWEKEQLNLDHAPQYLGFTYLTEEVVSASVKNVQSGTDFHELWFDFSQDISYGGAVMLNFTWADFNLPDNGEFSVSIGINEPDTLFEEDLSTVPVPAAIWFFATGILGMVAFTGKKKNQIYC